jgi:16S rRNA processing protein RimM
MYDDFRILVGRIVAPQGLNGELRVQTFTESPADLLDFPALKLHFVRTVGKNVAICKLDGVSDRTTAEKLRGTELFINRSDLPKLKKGEHYITDLIGMKVRMEYPESQNVAMQEVVAVHNFGAGCILELDNGKMISFNSASVDYEKKEIKL